MVQESSLELLEGKLSYAVVTGSDYYDINSHYEVVEENDYKYVTSKDGIEYRDEPDGEVLGKIAHGTQVHITGITGLKKMRYVDGKKVVFEWVQIELDRTSREKAFVLDRYLSLESEIDFPIQVSSTDYIMVKENDYKYVNAENGLVYRDRPEGDKIGKFSYGTKVHLTGKTGLVKTVYDNNERIVGEWVEVEIDEEFTQKAFVFNGYLAKEEEINNRLATLKSEVVFEGMYDKGIILPGKHLVYDRKLQEISSITFYEITEVIILEKTKKKRPQKNEAEYCRWANYLVVSIMDKQLILFGRRVLKFSVDLGIILEKGERVTYIEAQDYTVETSDEYDLTGCDDYSKVYIKSNNMYNELYYLTTDSKKNGKEKIIVHDEGMSENIIKIKVKNDTINIDMHQYFQEGQGSYILRIFKNNGWKCIETNKKM